MPGERAALLITRDYALAECLAKEWPASREPAGDGAERRLLAVFDGLEPARARLRTAVPSLIVFDDSMLAAAPPFGGLAEELAAFAPVIVLAAPERQREWAVALAEHPVDVVVRYGDFLPVLLALIARQLRRALEASDAGLPPGFLELLRHEVNNPLTGILGNAEMLLVRREQLPASAAQRLETIAELALRLRESLRRLTWAWEDPSDAARTA